MRWLLLIPLSVVSVPPSPPFSQEQSAIIQDAWSEWDTLAGEKLERSTIVFRQVTYITGFPETTVGLTIWRSPLVIEIQLKQNMGACDFRTVVMHEIGHAIGLAHVTDRPSVMQPFCQNMTPHPTNEDIDHARAE